MVIEIIIIGMFQLILATDSNNGIGYKGALPWPKHKKDMAFFRTKTVNNIVIMGRKTWESLPVEHRPLKDRINIVLTSDTTMVSTSSDVYFDHSIIEVMIRVKQLTKGNGMEVFVIGGTTLYTQFLNMRLVDKIWLCYIDTGTHRGFLTNN